mmetsp:Transcript_26545/g.81605  ORF Transcript_26545/g.81605 Transcript_26545/m.81605 type:complete len:154 (-) Transcript_26545:423-884(-)
MGHSRSRTISKHGPDAGLLRFVICRLREKAPSGRYYRGATAAIIVFDVTKEGSWEKVETWHQDLMRYAEPGVVIGVAGNKTDMPPAPGFDVEACRLACAQWGASFHLTSAITGSGVNELFLTVAKHAVRVHASYQAKGRLLEKTPHGNDFACC